MVWTLYEHFNRDKKNFEKLIWSKSAIGQKKKMILPQLRFEPWPPSVFMRNLWNTYIFMGNSWNTYIFMGNLWNTYVYLPDADAILRRDRQASCCSSSFSGNDFMASITHWMASDLAKRTFRDSIEDYNLKKPCWQ